MAARAEPRRRRFTFWRCYWAFWGVALVAAAVFEPDIEGGAQMSYAGTLALLWGFVIVAALALAGGIKLLMIDAGEPGRPTQNQLLEAQNRLLREQNEQLERIARR